MALTTQRKAELAAMDLPSDADMVARATVFQQRTGLTSSEFSQAIGYAPSSLHVYLNGHFNNPLTDEHDPTRNTRNIRAALKSFMDRWEGEQAEVIEFAHATADYRRIVDSCTKALEHGSAYVIDGPPGTQKTFSLRAAERAINARGDGRSE